VSTDAETFRVLIDATVPHGQIRLVGDEVRVHCRGCLAQALEEFNAGQAPEDRCVFVPRGTAA
jgi:hypothetical protein